MQAIEIEIHLMQDAVLLSASLHPQLQLRQDVMAGL